jgi:hypothetical protein
MWSSVFLYSAVWPVTSRAAVQAPAQGFAATCSELLWDLDSKDLPHPSPMQFLHSFYLLLSTRPPPALPIGCPKFDFLPGSWIIFALVCRLPQAWSVCLGLGFSASVNLCVLCVSALEFFLVSYPFPMYFPTTPAHPSTNSCSIFVNVPAK